MGEEPKYIRCKRCNRVLKSENAQYRGYGEHCWKIYTQEQQSRNILFDLSNKEVKDEH